MPPNRKTNVTLEDIPTFDVAQLKLAGAEGATRKPSSNQQTEPEVSYWDWPTHEDPLVERILQEETIRVNLSVSHIEENLVKEAQRLAAAALAAKDESKVDNDDYWNMTSSTTSEEREVQEQHEEPVAAASSCQWPSVVVVDESSKEQMIQMILEEERARQLTSVGFYEKGIVASSGQLTNTAAFNADNDAYWAC